MAAYTPWIDPLTALLWKASDVVMEVYREGAGVEVQYKEDQSPLTLADLNSHRVILEGLQKLTPDWPVLSEESEQIAWQKRKEWKRYWLVDPLDGTKEFVAANGEFTINLALIEGSSPALGLVAVPAQDRLYLGYPEAGICRLLTRTDEPVDLACRPMGEVLAGERPVGVVASRSHTATERLKQLLDTLEANFSAVKTQMVGSALKLCLLAEGSADLYPRLTPTSEWDIAAAQAVLKAAGGEVFQLKSGDPLRYNTKEDLLNPEFFAVADSTYAWHPLMKGLF